MTHVDKSPVTREVKGNPYSINEANEYVAKMTPEGLYIREKGRRMWYGPMSWDFIFRRGVDLTVQRAADAKPKRKRAVSRNLLGR